MYGHHRAFFTKDIDPIGDLIIPFCSQLTHISLSSSPHLLYPFLQTSPTLFNVLESLTLTGEVYQTGYDEEYIPKFTAFNDTPSLRRVLINNFFADFLPYISEYASDLPWAQLTHITLRNTCINLATAFSIVQWCKSAVHCELLFVGEAPVFRPPSIFHSHLQSLKISSDSGSPNVAVQFLQPLILPSLTSVEFTDRKTTEIIPSLVSLIIRSSCTLQRFVYTKAAVSATDLQLLFPILQSVEELTVPQTMLTESMLQHISQGVLLPKLKRVDLSLPSSPWALECFMEMVQSGGSGNPGSRGLRAASARYHPGAVRHSRAPRWFEMNKRFKELSAKLHAEGRTLTLKD